jgi:hypothetical protein
MDNASAIRQSKGKAFTRFLFYENYFLLNGKVCTPKQSGYKQVNCVDQRLYLDQPIT